MRLALIRAALPVLFIVSVCLAIATWRADIAQKTGGFISSRALALTSSAGFTVQDMLVTGRSRVDADILRHTLNVNIGAPIFGVDLEAAQKSIAQLGDIKNVSIARRLPDRLVISLEERAPAALWQNNKKISVVDKEGVVLGVEASQWSELPLIIGASAGPHAGEMLSLLQAEPGILKELSAAQRIGDRRWDLRLKNGMTIKLPEENAGFALRRLMEAQDSKKVFERSIASIDLRQPDKMVISTKGS